MSEIVVRAMEPDDMPALAELFEQPRAIWGTFQLPYTSVEARRKRFASTPESHTLLAAVADGKVVGTGGLHPFDHRRRAHVASLGMAVHDAYAGRGIGTALLSALLEQADRWLNYKRVELTVWADNPRAIALYERFGFEREGVFRSYGWRDGAYADAVTMARLRL